MKQRYKKLSEYASENSITYRTAWNHFKKELIPGAFKDETGHVKIPIFPETNEMKTAILYARVWIKNI